jgi:hypothetical protein
MSQTIPLSALSGVDRIAFGTFLSPNYINPTGLLAGMITPTPTGIPISAPVPVPVYTNSQGYASVSYHLFLPPSNLMAPGGFPVAIYGHGLADNQFGAPTFIASTLAQVGIATLAIEIQGHGYGPGSTVTVAKKSGAPVTVWTPGRGVPLNGPAIGPSDGCIGPGPIGVRDCSRQTAVDLFAITRTIQVTNGLGLNLNPARVYYIGQSFGSIYGPVFHAIEPSVKAAVLSVGGGTSVDISRLSPLGRALGMFYLGTSNPPLLNVPPAPLQAYFHDAFNDNYVYRNSGPVVNNVTGAVAVDSAFEIAEWLDMSGDPLAFASKLKDQPFPGLVGKATMVHFAYGDLEVPNPMNSAFIRAAGLESSSWYLRFDKAAAQHPELLGIMMAGSPLPITPHRFLSNPTIFDNDKVAENAISMAAQQQVAAYLAIGGVIMPNPNWFLQSPFAGQTLFEVPTTASLPEQLNFIQIQP